MRRTACAPLLGLWQTRAAQPAAAAESDTDELNILLDEIIGKAHQNVSLSPPKSEPGKGPTTTPEPAVSRRTRILQVCSTIGYPLSSADLSLRLSLATPRVEKTAKKILAEIKDGSNSELFVFRAKGNGQHIFLPWTTEVFRQRLLPCIPLAIPIPVSRLWGNVGWTRTEDMSISVEQKIMADYLRKFSDAPDPVIKCWAMKDKTTVVQRTTPTDPSTMERYLALLPWSASPHSHYLGSVAISTADRHWLWSMGQYRTPVASGHGDRRRS